MPRQLTPEMINGAEYNTREKQQSAYDNIEVRGNSLWGVKKTNTSVFPDINSQEYINQSKIKPADLTLPTDFSNEQNTQFSNPQERLIKGIDSTPYQENAPGTGIILSGKFTPEQQAIAKKYSMFFKSPVNFNVSDIVKRGSGKEDERLDGLTKFYNSGKRTLDLTNRTAGQDFAFAMLHEIAHRTFGYDEDAASNYARDMIRFVEGL